MRIEPPALDVRVRVRGPRRHGSHFTTYGAVAHEIAARAAAKARAAREVQERKREARARYRALRMARSVETGRRVILSILARPTPAGVQRLAGFLLDPAQPPEVRVRASRAILFLAYGPPPVEEVHDGERNHS